MSRNVSGVYTLPLPAVVPLTTITSSWANTTLDDLAAEMTNSLDRNGKGGMLAPLKSVDGTQSLPGLTFANDTSVGLFRESAGVIWGVAGSSKLFKMTATGLELNTGILLADQVLKLGDANAFLTYNSTATFGQPAVILQADTNDFMYYLRSSNKWRMRVGSSDILEVSSLGLDIVGLLSASGGVTTLGDVIGAKHLASADGSVSAPAFSWSGDPDTGLYRAAANTLNFAAGGALILSIDTTVFYIKKAVLIDNAVVMQWKNSGGTGTPVLQKYSDDVVYLDNYDGSVLIRAGNAGALNGAITVINGGNMGATGYIASGNNAACFFGKLNATLGVGSDLDISNAGSGLYVLRQNSDGGVILVSIDVGTGACTEISDPSGRVTVGADPGAGSNQLWVTVTGTTVRVRNRYGVAKSVTISGFTNGATPS